MRYIIVFASFFLISTLGFSQAFTSSNLPIIVINTNGGTISDEPKIEADMGIINTSTGVNKLTDAFNDYQGKIGIEFRGSSSQMFPKKPYGIELHDATGAGKKASLLGMPSEEDWTLNATYNDRSLLRDVLTYKLGRDLKRGYSPRTRYCELFINGNYQGIYILIEKIKRDKNRVDVNKLEPAETTGDDLTGGYILKIDKKTGSGGEGFLSPYPPPNRKGAQTIYFQYEYPKPTEIVTAQQQYIKKYIADFESALAASSFKDEAIGYQKYIDVNSFIDFLIINEITKNVDGYRISTFLYKDKDSNGGKIFMGPIWDFNLGFGNADYCQGGLYTGWAYNYNQVCGYDNSLVPFWWSKLLSDPAFKQKLGSRWEELRKKEFSTPVLHAYIDSVANVLTSAQQRNFTKWPIFNQYVWPNYDWTQQQNYPAAITWLKNWISSRTIWLDQNMPKSTPVPEPEPEIVTAVEVVKNEIQLIVSPNPFPDRAHIQYTIVKPGVVRMTMVDMTGRNVETIERAHLSAGTFEMFYSNLLPAGIYCLRVKFNDNNIAAKRLIKQ